MNSVDLTLVSMQTTIDSKLRVFIGSSTETREIAYIIQESLEDVAEVTVWDQDLSILSQTILNSLQQTLRTTDFGIFIFSPDDFALIRSQEVSIVRDNVLFELGLFMGYLGSDRCYIVTPENTNEFRIPNDLSGITFAKYDPNRTDKNIKAALGPTCRKIKSTIKQRGKFVLEEQ